MDKENSKTKTITKAVSRNPHYVYVTPEKKTKPVNHSPEKKKARPVSD